MIWILPWFQAAQGAEGLLLKGWRLADTTTIQGGFALTLGLATSNPGIAALPDRVAGSSISGPKTANEWLNTAAFFNPAPGYFGDAARGSITGPGVVNFDMAFYKNSHIKERHPFQFRVELFNIFNHTNFSGVQTAYGPGILAKLRARSILELRSLPCATNSDRRRVHNGAREPVP